MLLSFHVKKFCLPWVEIELIRDGQRICSGKRLLFYKLYAII